jgi:hypothetical protein
LGKIFWEEKYSKIINNSNMELKNYTTFAVLFITLVFMVYLTKRDKFVKAHNPSIGFELNLENVENENL